MLLPLLCVCLSTTTAVSNGALGSCFDITTTMAVGSPDPRVSTDKSRPMWWAFSPTKQTFYTVRSGDGTASSDPTSYVPGDLLTVHIRTLDLDRLWIGLYMYAIDSKGTQVGAWEIPNGAPFQTSAACQGRAIVHSNPDMKPVHTMFYFRAPLAGTGTLTLKVLIKQGEQAKGAFFIPTKELVLTEGAVPTAVNLAARAQIGNPGDSCDQVCANQNRACDPTATHAINSPQTLSAAVSMQRACWLPLLSTASCDSTSPQTSADSWCYYQGQTCATTTACAARATGITRFCSCTSGSVVKDPVDPNKPAPVTGRYLLKPYPLDDSGKIVLELLEMEGETLTAWLTGPADTWFAIGWGQLFMSGTYATVFNADISRVITERKLDNHAPGTMLGSSVTILLSENVNGQVSVKFTRLIKGGADYVNFDLEQDTLSLIWALGTSTTFGVHASKSLTSAPLMIPLSKTKGTYVVVPISIRPYQIEVHLSDEKDTVEESTLGTLTCRKPEINLVMDGAIKQTIGLRFAAVPFDPKQINQVKGVYLEFSVSADQSGPCSLSIKGEKSVTPTSFCGDEKAAVGWFNAAETQSCTNACIERNLVCTEAQLLAHNAEVDTSAEVVALSTADAGKPPTGGCKQGLASADVPVWNNGSCWYSLPNRTKIGQYRCSAVAGVGKHRVCYCHKPATLVFVTVAEVNACPAGMSAVLSQTVCLDAVEQLGLNPLTGLTNQTLNNPTDPKGCFRFCHIDGCDAFWNSHPTGNVAMGRDLICQATVTSGAAAAGQRPSQRLTTTTSVAWPNVPAWTASDLPQKRSPDLKPILQELIAKGWQKGGAVSFIITGSGQRSVSAFPNLVFDLKPTVGENITDSDNTDTGSQANSAASLRPLKSLLSFLFFGLLSQFATSSFSLSRAVSLPLLLLAVALPCPVTAHNWVNSPASRAQIASVAKPCQKRTSLEPYLQVAAMQEFEMEWSTGHGETNTKTSYWVAIHASDYDQLNLVEDALLEEYIKSAPASAVILKEDRYQKVHIAPAADNNGAVYQRQIFKGDPLFIDRDPVMIAKSFRARDFDPRQWQYKAVNRADDIRVEYTNAKYPWIEAVHKFKIGDWHYPNEYDSAHFRLLAKKGPGDYIMHFKWGGYRDCVDIEVLPTKVTNRYGLVPTAATNTDWYKLDHCEFTYIHELQTNCFAMGATNDAKTCLDSCKANSRCTAVQAVRVSNPAFLMSRPEHIPMTKWVDDPDHSTFDKYPPTMACNWDTVIDREKAGCTTAEPKCTAALTGSKYVCYGFSPFRNQDRQASEDFEIREDWEDPIFYSTCWLKSVQQGFLNPKPYVQPAPNWQANDRCISCSFYNSVKNLGLSIVPDWESGLSDQCMKC